MQVASYQDFSTWYNKGQLAPSIPLAAKSCTSRRPLKCWTRITLWLDEMLYLYNSSPYYSAKIIKHLSDPCQPQPCQIDPNLDSTLLIFRGIWLTCKWSFPPCWDLPHGPRSGCRSILFPSKSWHQSCRRLPEGDRIMEPTISILTGRLATISYMPFNNMTELTHVGRSVKLQALWGWSSTLSRIHPRSVARGAAESS